MFTRVSEQCRTVLSYFFDLPSDSASANRIFSTSEIRKRFVTALVYVVTSRTTSVGKQSDNTTHAVLQKTLLVMELLKKINFK